MREKAFFIKGMRGQVDDRAGGKFRIICRICGKLPETLQACIAHESYAFRSKGRYHSQSYNVFDRKEKAESAAQIHLFQ